MAERGGFEPPHGSYPPAGIRSQSLQPLGYLSTASAILTYRALPFQCFLRVSNSNAARSANTTAARSVAVLDT